MAYDATKDQNIQSSTEVNSQARGVYAVTPNDGADLAVYAKALYIGVTGDVSVVPVSSPNDTPVVFKAHPVGYMPVQVRRVMSTGTTATNILALTAGRITA